MRFTVLDSWRGVCALFVAIHNLNFGSWIPQTAFVAHSSLFVDFFFVLSGFVITHAYGEKLSDTREVATFVVRRLGRLWPLHVAVLALLVGLSLLKFLAMPGASFDLVHAAGGSLRSIGANFLLTQAFDPPSRLTWNTPSWSISTELWTYLLFAVVCLVGTARRAHILLAAGVAIVAGCLVLLWSPNYLENNTDYSFLRCLYGFFSGHLVYRAWTLVPSRHMDMQVLEVLALALVIGFVLVVGSDVASLAAPLIFGFAVWVFAHENGSASKFLRTRPFVQLGTWSYSIYMVHWTVRNVLVHLDPFFAKVNHGWATFALLAAYLMVVIALAAGTYALIEQPARRVFNRMADRISFGTRRSA